MKCDGRISCAAIYTIQTTPSFSIVLKALWAKFSIERK
jgi:hypothetical protein